jgi:hypothetical protein
MYNVVATDKTLALVVNVESNVKFRKGKSFVFVNDVDRIKTSCLYNVRKS